LTITDIRLTDDDLVVKFRDAAGKTFTRSGNSDLRDPIREFLMIMAGYIGIGWEDQLFPP